MASGNILAMFYPPGDPTSSNYGTFDTRNQHPVSDFDASTDEQLCWEFDMPPQYSGGGVRATVKWMATSATSGDTLPTVYFERLASGGQDLDSDGFSTAQQATATAPGTSGALAYTDIDSTDGSQIDSIVAGDHARFRFKRTASGGGDTMTGDMEIVSIVLKEI